MLTTSRYPSIETRQKARTIAKTNGQKFVSRSKRTIAQLVSMARRMGEHTITIIEEKDKKPSNIATIVVDELGRWSWSADESNVPD